MTPYEDFDRMWKEEMEGGPISIALNILSIITLTALAYLLITGKI